MARWSSLPLSLCHDFVRLKIYWVQQWISSNCGFVSKRGLLIVSAPEALNEINIFELVDTDVVEKALHKIGEKLFHLPKASPLLGVSKGSGWLHFLNQQEIRSARRKPSLPETPAAAQEAGTSFFSHAAQLFLEPWYSELKIPALFPKLSDLEFVAALGVPHPETGAFDHWLVRYRVSLQPSILPAPGSLGQGTVASKPIPARIPVVGGGIDLRIGDKGTVIGLNSCWRPPKLYRRSILYPHPEDTPPMQLVYLLNDEHAEQSYLAPYYQSFSTDDEGSFLPASIFSPLVFILEQPEEGRTRLDALVIGGSGQYEYQWTRWSPLLDWDKSFKTLGSGVSQQVGVGVFDVAVNVKDSVTGATVRAESMIYSPSRQGVV